VLKEVAAAILGIAFLLSTVSSPLLIASPPFRSYSEISMYILAVGEAGGKYFGVPTLLDVIVTNGSGIVYLSTEPLAEVDMQASARLAALIASYVAGKPFYKYDYFISVKSNSSIVGGPSAGAAMTVAIAAALLHKKVNKSVVETGMIMPDGTIGPVGGIPEKLNAAAEVHAKVMLIPSGQKIAYSLSKGRYVDVIQEGKKLGVKVVQVSTIYDALKWFGISVPQPSNVSVSLNSNIVKVIKSWINRLKANYSTMEKLARSEVLKLKEGASIVSSYLKSSRALYKRAQDDLEKEKYYSAASDLFGASINASTAYWLAEMISGKKTYADLLNFTRREVHKALETYNRVREEVLKSGDLVKLSIAVEVASRAMEANKSLSQLPSEPSSPLDVYSAVYTYYRARTVMDWSEMFSTVKGSGIKVSSDSLKKDTSLLVYFARTTASYIESLLGNPASVSEVIELVNEADSLEERDIIASLAVALRASAMSSTLLNSAFSTDLNGTALRLRSAAFRALGISKASGFEPIIALSYIERGDTLRKIDEESAIYFYDLALINTMWYMVITGTRPSYEVSITSTTSTQRTESTTSKPGLTTPLIPENITKSTSTSISREVRSPTSTSPVAEVPTSPISDIVVDISVILGSIIAGFLLGFLVRKGRGSR